jgi:hypothetical protein
MIWTLYDNPLDYPGAQAGLVLEVRTDADHCVQAHSDAGGRERRSRASTERNAGKLRRSSVWKFVRKESLPNCRGVIDPVAFFETESLS